MPSLAEIWIERGELRGRLNEIYNGIKRGLIFKFEQLGESLFLMTQKIEDIEKLQKIQDALLVINDADEFKRFIQKQQQNKTPLSAISYPITVI